MSVVTVLGVDARRGPDWLFHLSGGVLLVVIACTIFAPLVAPYDPTATDFLAIWSPPSPVHWLGIDQLGLGVALVFVTHDLAVVGEVSDDVLVMYRGRVVEHRPTADVLRRPEHPYTDMLLSSAPRPGWEPERVVELRAEFACE